jgi:hypothetical protein
VLGLGMSITNIKRATRNIVLINNGNRDIELTGIVITEIKTGIVITEIKTGIDRFCKWAGENPLSFFGFDFS